MVLIDVPAPVAEAFRLGESSGAKMQWRCSSSANYLSVGLRWISSEGERSRAGLNSRQRRSQRRLQEFLQRKTPGHRKKDVTHRLVFNNTISTAVNVLPNTLVPTFHQENMIWISRTYRQLR